LTSVNPCPLSGSSGQPHSSHVADRGHSSPRRQWTAERGGAGAGLSAEGDRVVKLYVDLTGKRIRVSREPEEVCDEYGGGQSMWTTQVYVQDESGGEVITVATTGEKPNCDGRRDRGAGCPGSAAVVPDRQRTAPLRDRLPHPRAQAAGCRHGDVTRTPSARTGPPPHRRGAVRSSPDRRPSRG
jgi:hypothetical protein